MQLSYSRVKRDDFSIFHIFSPVCGKGEKRPRVLSRSDWKKALVKMRRGDEEKQFKAIAEKKKV